MITEGTIALGVQKFFEEAADLAAPVDQVDLQDPLAAATVSIGPPHRSVTARGDVGLDPVPVDGLMRELADQVAGDLAAELPPVAFGQLRDVGVQLLAGHLGPGSEERLASVEHDGQGVAQALFDGVGAQDEGAAEVGFPAVEHRSEVAKDDVVDVDQPVGRVFAKEQQSVGAG